MSYHCLATVHSSFFILIAVVFFLFTSVSSEKSLHTTTNRRSLAQTQNTLPKRDTRYDEFLSGIHLVVSNTFGLWRHGLLTVPLVVEQGRTIGALIAHVVIKTLEEADAESVKQICNAALAGVLPSSSLKRATLFVQAFYDAVIHPQNAGHLHGVENYAGGMVNVLAESIWTAERVYCTPPGLVDVEKQKFETAIGNLFTNALYDVIVATANRNAASTQASPSANSNLSIDLSRQTRRFADEAGHASAKRGSNINLGR